MRKLISEPRCTLFHGDAVALSLPPSSVDAIVTDPPAGIGFMGKEWDGSRGGRDAWIAWLANELAPAFIALKPGGHALVWALPRTSHWTATALENLGFEIRDIHHHLFGTGFPKSLNLVKAGAGEDWAGWGTALKPACEHWILCRKPLDGTVAANVLRHGTGGLNIDACRIGDNPGYKYNAAKNGTTFHGEQGARNTQTAAKRGRDVVESTKGRWPAHVSLDEEAAAVLDEQSGPVGGGRGRAGGKVDHAAFGGGIKNRGNEFGYADAGGASRFFYVAKPSRAEKTAAGPNAHPTVKSVALMRWLIRLITLPGGIVLDPFAGTGSTGVAALAEGMRFIGVEQGGENDKYLPIIEGRLRHALGSVQT